MDEQKNKHTQEPNPDWSKANSEQICDFLMSIRPSQSKDKMNEALWKVPQKDEEEAQ